MKRYNKTVQALTLTVLLIGTYCAQTPAQTTDTKLSQTLKVKDFYINRIAANAKGVMHAVRFIHAGFSLRSISLLGGPYTVAGVILGDLITSLALLRYGHKMTATFVAIKRVGEILQKNPKIASFMSHKDWKIFNGGKSVFRGPILNAMHKKKKIANAINEASTSIVHMFPDLIKKIPERRLKQALSRYFNWAIDIKTYQEALKKKEKLFQEKKAPSSLIKKASKLVDKIITAPAFKKGIERREKNSRKLLNTIYPDLGQIGWFLSYTADKLFRQVKKIKKKHSRKFSLFKREKPLTHID